MQHFAACAQGQITPSRHAVWCNQGPDSMSEVGSVARPQWPAHLVPGNTIPAQVAASASAPAVPHESASDQDHRRVAATEHMTLPFMPAPSPAAHAAGQTPPAQAPAVWHAPASWRPRQNWVACGGAAARYARPHCRCGGQHRRDQARLPAPALAARRLPSGLSLPQLVAQPAEAPAASVCGSAAAAPYRICTCAASTV